MEQQNESTLEEVSLANSNDLINENNLLALCQSKFQKFEFRSCFFYILQIFEMLFITVTSTLTVISTNESDNSSVKFLNFFISLCYISPSLFSHSFVTYLIVGIILLLILLIIGYTIYIGYKIRKDETSLSPKCLQPWVIMHRLILPFPGIIIGCYFGYYFKLLTRVVCQEKLFFIIYTGLLWCWSIVSSCSLYNSRQYQRKYDICQIQSEFVLFECFITIFPLFQAIMPYIISIFITSESNTVLYSCLTIMLSILVILFVPLKKPYYSDFMNNYVIFLYSLKIPISLVWMVEKIYPNHLGIYIIFCLVFSITTFLLIKFISFCIQNYLLTNHTQTQTSQTQNNIRIENQDSDLQLNFQLVDEHTNQPSIRDPFINCRYPFNLISLTNQDILLAIHLVSSVVIMMLCNAVAAKRMPISKQLPDLIQDHFYIADELRNAADSPFIISNVVVLVQIPLLVLFIFGFPHYFNIRRFVFIYGVLCCIRTVSFLITSLPAPCTGAPRCPCSDPKVIQNFSEGSAVKIAFTWLFGLGIFLKYPQCGDLIISGHTMWLWITTRSLCSVMTQLIPKPISWLANSALITLTLIAMCYIILAKNHYSIDVWFGFVLTEMLFLFYNSLWGQAIHPPNDNDSLLVRLIRFLETRPPKRILIQTKKMQLKLNT